jgi:hypothetical protein
MVHRGVRQLLAQRPAVFSAPPHTEVEADSEEEEADDKEEGDKEEGDNEEADNEEEACPTAEEVSVRRCGVRGLSNEARASNL